MALYRAVAVFVLCSWNYRYSELAGDVESSIRGVLEYVCHGADVCRENTTSATRPFPRGMKSCCTDCSCEDGCGLTGNCCFPAQSHGREDGYQTCTFVTFPEPDKNNHHLYESYYIVTKPPTNGCPSGFGPKNKQSKETASELSPVYSKLSGTIYLNMDLALCHGEHDVIQWDAVLACDDYDQTNQIEYDLSSYAEAAVSKSGTSYCQLHFRFPGDKNSVVLNRCFRDVINTCRNTSFEVPRILNWARKDIKQACQSGFFSPYLYNANYANVFCHICNGEHFSKYTVCRTGDDRGVLTKSFTCMLNVDLLSHFRDQHKTVDESGHSLACPNTSSSMSGCRTIHCPTGQLTVPNGTCIWLFETAGAVGFSVNLRLVPRLPIPMTDPNLATSVVETYTRWLTSTWSPPWTVQRILYESAPWKPPVIMQLFAELYIYGEGRKLINILKSVERNMKKPWRSMFSNASVYLDQSFAGFNFVRSAGAATPTFVALDANPGHQTLVKRNLSLLFQHRKPQTVNSFSITKMFLCKQIELEDHEYDIDDQMLALTYENKTLPATEFSLVSTPDGRYVARICLEDSGMYIRVRGLSWSIFEKKNTKFTFVKIGLVIALGLVVF